MNLHVCASLMPLVLRTWYLIVLDVCETVAISTGYATCKFFTLTFGANTDRIAAWIAIISAVACDLLSMTRLLMLVLLQRLN